MAKKKSEAVSVLSQDGTVIRTYSLAEHGKDFRGLADEFASKEAGREVIDSKVEEVDAEDSEEDEEDEKK